MTTNQRRALITELQSHPPKPNIPVPIMGMIQWIFAWADQPYQLNDMKKLNKVVSVMRVHRAMQGIQESDGYEKGTKEQRWHTHLGLPPALVLICQL